MTPGKPIWPRVPSGFVRAVLAGHSALGLAFAALIYLVCFSGTVAVFVDEFRRWERPDVAPVAAVSPEALQRAASEAVARYGKAEHVFIYPPTAAAPRLRIYVDPEKGEDAQMLAGPDGRALGDLGTDWSEFMARLHINLHLPQTWGIFVVGLTGVALLSSLISGLFAHPRVFRDAFHLRWGGSKRLQEADLHNRIGVWGLPFHVMISLTGALLGLTTIVVGVLALAVFKGDTEKAYALFLPPHPADDPRPAPMPDIERALANLARMAPGQAPTLVGLEHPGERGGGILIIAGTDDRTLSRGDSHVFDARGEPMADQDPGRGTLGAAILQAIGQLHFGWYGGLAVKAVYGLLGVGITVVTASGVAIWLARRRARGRPAPRWERVWIAAAWSQPFAYAASALAAVLAGAPPLPVWGGATVAALAGALVWTPARLSRRLRLAAGALLGLLGTAHIALWWGRIADPVAWGVDVALILLALGLLTSATRLRPAPAALAAEPAE
ncbi:PepSY-associated TM helix domain-containing protein [Phenylobacterium sp.]|uniref:PepSY-associated TM helix domain-containing protein n=1 Tax=Phenylobacterium sp. TaxID=1871053 RepID=UPI00301E1914